MDIDLATDKKYEILEASVIKAMDIRDFNDFETEEKVFETKLETVEVKDGIYKVKLPAHSLAMIRFK